MSAFNEELTAARKAKGMTQEQLAAAVNASRSAVSHWESGRSAPDLETVGKLSKLLGCTFSVVTAPKDTIPEPPSPSPIPEPPCPDLIPKTPPHRSYKGCIAIIAAVALIVAACIAIPKLVKKPRSVEPTAENVTFAPVLPPKGDTVEWFSAAVQPESGKPFVAVQFNENPLRLMYDDFPEGVGWLYTTYLTETNGYPLDIKGIDIVMFKTVNEPDVFSYDSEMLNDWFDGTHILPANGQFIFNGGMPFSDTLKGVGVRVTGTDESGAELEFHAYVPLSDEVRE